MTGSLTVNNSEVLRPGGRIARLRSQPGQMDIGIYAVYPASRRGSAKIRLLIDLLQAALSGAG